MGNSKIYDWISLGFASVVTVVCTILLYVYGIFSSTSCGPLTVMLVGVWCMVCLITHGEAERWLSKKYEYTFENYIYRIRVDTLASGKVRFYPVVTIAKYGTDQYIEEVTQDDGIRYFLTKFTSKKQMKEYKPAKNVRVFYDTQSGAKAAIELYKKYTKELDEAIERKLKVLEDEKRNSQVVSSRFLD